MSKLSKEKLRCIQLENQLRMLQFASLRVWRTYGHDDNNTPLDWNKWVDLKRECDKVITLIGVTKWPHLSD